MAAECRYTQIGDLVIGKAQMTVTAAGSGAYRIPLPVTPRTASVYARRMGTLQIDAGARVSHFWLEQANAQAYCNAALIQASGSGSLAPVAAESVTPADTLVNPEANLGVVFLSSATYTAYSSLGAVTLSWDFTYEAA